MPHSGDTVARDDPGDGRPSGASDVPRVGRFRAVAEVASVFLLVLIYLWPFRLYGFDVTDEGVQLVQIERALAGERPYRDFETSYTPAYFAAYALLWRATGSDLVATRTAQVVLHSAVVATGFALARAWASGGVALGVTLFQVAFLLPVSLRFGAPFNVPYPGWLATAAALAAQVLIAALAHLRAVALESGRVQAAGRAATFARPRAHGVGVAVLPLAAGAAAGLAFSIKPNAGLLALGGVALAATAGWPMRSLAARRLARVVRAGAALGVVALLQAGFEATVLVALAVPVWLATLRVTADVAATDTATDRAPAANALGGRAALFDLAAIGAGFALVVVPWFVPLARDIGAWPALTAILHLEGSVVRAYLVAFPAPALASLPLAAGLAGASWLAGGSNARRARRAPAALAAGLALAAGVVLAGPVGQAGLRLAAENACLWLGPLLLTLALATCSRAPAGARERALLAFAAVYQLQLYPRPDPLHVAMGAAPILLAVAVAWSRRVRQWCAALLRGAGAAGAAQAAAASRRAARAVAAGIALLAAGRAVPTLVERLRGPIVDLDLGPRAPLIVSARHSGGFDRLVAAVRAVRAHSSPGDAIFAFPDLAGIGFLAERRLPYFYLYFVPGRPSREMQGEILDEIDRARPVVAVVGQSSVPAFAGATEYFDQIARHLSERYRPIEQAGEYSILVRRDVAAAADAR